MYLVIRKMVDTMVDIMVDTMVGDYGSKYFCN
jgi:hypothetical protein